MALSDIYQVVFRQLWNQAEPMLNVMHYRRQDISGSAEGLRLAWMEDIYPVWRAAQSDIIWYQILQVANLGDPTDWSEVTFTNARGAAAGEALPPHSTINFTLRPEDRRVRPGSKRLPGVPQDWVTNGIVDAAGGITSYNNLRTALSNNLQVGAGTLYTPIIVKRVKDTNENGKEYYRLPETDGELLFSDLFGVLWNTKVSHQVSRGNSR